MTSRKEALSRLTKLVLETRSEVRAGLEVVEAELREGSNGLSLYATGNRVTFGQIDEDDWEYGMLNFGGTGISQSTGALRTHLGTAHGGDKTANADEARLSNNLACAVEIYVLEKLKNYMVVEKHE
jgi:hypothetical protein